MKIFLIDQFVPWNLPEWVPLKKQNRRNMGVPAILTNHNKQTVTKIRTFLIDASTRELIFIFPELNFKSRLHSRQTAMGPALF
jgi:hypothetical protein